MPANESRSGLSIRLKIIVIVLVSTFTLIVIMAAVSQNILSKSYAEIERESLVRNLGRADDAIQNAVDQLDIKLVDWATWDDTYQFIDDLNDDYRDGNLQNSALANIQIHAMVFADREGSIKLSKVISQGGEEADPSDIHAYVAAHKERLPGADAERKLTGIALFPDYPAIFVSRPILPTSGEGEPRGSLSHVKFIDDVFIEHLGELTHLTVDLYRLDGPTLPTDVADAKSRLVAGDENVILPQSAERIAAYTIIDDIDGKPALLLRVETPRDIVQQGEKTLYTFIVIAGGAILLFGILFLMERYVISRVVTLEREIASIGDLHDVTKRVTEGSGDELGTLAGAINRMLLAIGVSESGEREATRKALDAGQKLEEQLAEIKKMNALMVDRELKMVQLKKQNEELQALLKTKSP